MVTKNKSTGMISNPTFIGCRQANYWFVPLMRCTVFSSMAGYMKYLSYYFRRHEVKRYDYIVTFQSVTFLSFA